LELKKLVIGRENYYFDPKIFRIYAVDAQTALQIDQALDCQDSHAVNTLLGSVDATCPQKCPDDWDPGDASTQLSLMLTESCNMRCRYCWQGPAKPVRHMPYKVACQAVDFMMLGARAGERALLRLFGGEPTLCFGLIRKIIPYAEAKAREHRCDLLFTLTTNGTLVTPIMVDYMAQHHCMLDISLDGLPHVHDAQRVYPDGRPSHAQVEKALRYIVANIHPAMVRISMTVHHKSVPYLEQNIEYIRGLGAHNISINPVESDDPQFALTSDDFERIAAYLQTKCLLYDGLTHNPYQATIKHRYLERIDLNKRRRVHCVGGHSAFCIGTDGGIYPCSGFALENAYAMGHVSTDLEPAQQQAFFDACGTVDDSPSCQDCWARYLCGGPCYSFSYALHRDVRRPTQTDCQHSRIFIESALRTYISLATKNGTGAGSAE
jgi:uncharacterized protein